MKVNEEHKGMSKGVERGEKSIIHRCRWCGAQPLYQAYHDDEWGNPNKSESELWELFALETQHAGLSWWTVLSKREAYRKAFRGFDPLLMSQMDDVDIEQLMQNAGIIRNRLKISAMIHNAERYLSFCQQYRSFSDYFWGKVGGKPIINVYQPEALSPITTPLSDEIAKELKKFGFKFFGSRTAYAFLQAAGMVYDHLAECDLSADKIAD